MANFLTVASQSTHRRCEFAMVLVQTGEDKIEQMEVYAAEGGTVADLLAAVNSDADPGAWLVNARDKTTKALRNDEYLNNVADPSLILNVNGRNAGGEPAGNAGKVTVAPV
mmetsp:Transcript_13440/g.40002  ORF Transcript_13440/g.40002 Transcript_13440/m.40002 type:complete len:111 (+) Transcript_13440:2-334(+)